MKTCSKCKQNKAYDEFRPKRADCKICWRLQIQLSKHRNLEVLRARRVTEWHRRDAMKRSNLYESVDVLVVYARDGYTCQLCFDAVDTDLKFPHPQSKSLDHIDAVSKGGAHMYFNVQLAHFRCNQLKSNRR